MFSKACEYGIRAMVYIAGESHRNSPVGLKDIAREIDSPVAFTAKILQGLAKSKLLDSVKGPQGGFYLSELNASRLTLDKIVAAIDGDQLYRGCALGLKQCSEVHPCPLHNQFKAIREDLRVMLESTSVQTLAIRRSKGEAILKY